MKVTLNNLTFNIRTSDAAMATEVQRRVSAMADGIASRIEDALEPFVDPEAFLSIPRLEITLTSVTLEDLEDQLTVQLFNALREQLSTAMLPEVFIPRSGSDFDLSVKSLAERERDVVRQFLLTGLHGGPDDCVTSLSLKKALYEQPVLADWILAIFGQHANLVPRLLWHMTDEEMRSLILGAGFVKKGFIERMTSVVADHSNMNEFDARCTVWRELFSQRSKGLATIDPVTFVVAGIGILDTMDDDHNDQVGMDEDSDAKHRSGERGPDVYERTTEVGELSMKHTPQAVDSISADLSEKMLEVDDEMTTSTTVRKGPGAGKNAAQKQVLSDNEIPVVDTVAKGDSEESEETKNQGEEREASKLASARSDSEIDSDDLSSFGANTVYDDEMVPEVQAMETTRADGVKGNSKRPGYTEPVSAHPPEIVLPSKVFIRNAGLVLTAPFLPAFFSNLGYVVEGRFVDTNHQRRAARLLQEFLPEFDRSEAEMPLNKLLCGLSMDEPIPHWRVLKDTSVDGFKTSFFEREGVLEQGDRQWLLRIKRESVDVLLDTLPWPISMIKHKWMEHPIMVEW
jgi:hypothetical protein